MSSGRKRKLFLFSREIFDLMQSLFSYAFFLIVSFSFLKMRYNFCWKKVVIHFYQGKSYIILNIQPPQWCPLTCGLCHIGKEHLIIVFMKLYYILTDA